MLRLGSLGLGGLALPDLLRARAEGKIAAPRDETSVIFVWLPGGLSHLESYDMKPNAPIEYRGDFRPVSTKVAGTQICELFPRQAQIADKYNIIRSVAHEFADHGGGHKRFMMARDPREPAGFVNDFPAQPSLISKIRGRSKSGLPNYILGGNRGNIDTFSLGSAYLSTDTHPFMMNGDPSDPKFKVENIGVSPEMEQRVGDRLALLKGFDNLRRDTDRHGLMDSMDEFNRRAYDLMTSERARKAFDISLESQKTRERFGIHPFGQRGLMALRLVEAGCSFVTMVWENPSPPGTSIPVYASYNWDSHAVNADIFKEAREWRFAYYDQAVTALIEGLYERGLDKKTLVIITGEFGRTPRVNPAVGTQTKVMQPGRDHWPGAMSFIVSGGGMRTGQVVGATSSKGEYPVDRRMTPNDLWASVYRHLGLNPETAFLDHAGRPMPALPYGTPIPEMAAVGA
jgi:hypothetical protein